MHREERQYSIVLSIRAEFGDDYVGDEDGFEWFARFEQGVKPRLLHAVFEALRADPSLDVRSAPRGRDPDVGIDLEVVYRPDSD